MRLRTSGSDQSTAPGTRKRTRPFLFTMYVSGYCDVPNRFAVASFGSWNSGNELGFFATKSSMASQSLSTDTA